MMRAKQLILQGVVSAWAALTISGSLAADAEPAGKQICVEVLGVHDGDTFRRFTDTGPLRVRMAGVDAPETGQAFWRVSRDMLKQRAAPGTVVDCYKVDRFKRQVCRVAAPSGSDAALELVQAGLAWRTRKYADEQTLEERELYAEAESVARERGLGIWSQPDPQEPVVCRGLKALRQKCR